MPQRSSEWYAVRAGRLTASEAHIPGMSGKKKGEESTTRRDLRTRLALERLTGQPQGEAWSNADTERGIALEAEALAAYEGRSGHLLSAVGFVSAEDIGCSPDGALVDFDQQILGGVDVKCPRAANHLAYLENPASLVAAYEAQMAHTLLVTGAPWWDLASYCPAFRGLGSSELLVVRVVPSGPVEVGANLSADYLTTVQAVDVAAHELVVRQFLLAVEDTVTAIRQTAGMEAA